ncbi:MAG TPA: FMN-binding protein [Tissierellaceae bacterium]|nr:FMN-binding protein [Tissierellaceae bacterium]
MKKILTLGLILILSLSVLVACQQSDETAYEDGSYNAESDLDDNGWKGVIDIKVEDSKITEVNYDEVDENENKKTEDEEYSEDMDNSSGIMPEDAYEQLEEALINTQNPDQIDAIAGATSSSEQFKKLAEEALNE